MKEGEGLFTQKRVRLVLNYLLVGLVHCLSIWVGGWLAVCCLAGWVVCWLDRMQIAWLVDSLVSQSIVWLVTWLLGWMAGWLNDSLIDWLVGKFLEGFSSNCLARCEDVQVGRILNEGLQLMGSGRCTHSARPGTKVPPSRGGLQAQKLAACNTGTSDSHLQRIVQTRPLKRYPD